VAWLPGPAGAGFVELFDKGFKDGIKGGAIEILETKYGDLGKEVQTRLIEDVLQTHKNLDYIVGSAVAAEAGVPVLRSRNMQGKIKLVALYMTPGVYQGIKAKTIDASYMEPAVNIARVAVNQAVKVLQKEPIMRTLVTVGGFYDQTNIGQMNPDAAFAPNSFRPVFQVKAK
jgi:protein TorT